MTALAHLKIDLDGFNGADSPPIGAWTRVQLDPQVDVTDPAADKVYVGRVSVSLGPDGRPTTANGAAVDPAIGVPLLAGVVYAVSSTALRTTGTVGPLTEGQTYNLADVYVPGAPLTPDQASALAARVTALEATPPGSGVTDHGALTGLGEDDHPQYLTTGRGDARYPLGTDPRLSDARPPTVHASSHARGAADPLAVTDLGVGSLADGQMLVRSGSTLVGQAVPSGGGGSLTYVTANTDVPDGTMPGQLVGYYNAASTSITVEGGTVAAGAHVILMWTGTAWQVLGTSGGGTVTPPGAPTITVDNAAETSLSVAYSGAGPQYRLRIDSGAWVSKSSAGTHTFTGLTAGTSHTIEAQQSADSGTTWSASSSWTGSTAAAPAPTWTTWASDDFTGADGSLIGRVTPVGAKVWTNFDGGFNITSNRASMSGIYNPFAGFAVPGTGPRRVSVDYDMRFIGNSISPVLGILNGGVVELTAGGGNAFSAGPVDSVTINGMFKPGGGNPDFALTGTLTGHPAAARVSVEVNGYDVSVSINGTVVASGTATFDVAAASDTCAIKGAAGDAGNCTFDNFLIETIA